MFSSRFWRYSPRYVNVLRLLWIVLIAWYELGIFYHQLSSCVWPDEDLVHESHSFDDNFHDLHPTRVLLVADPQVLDLHSYPDRSHTLSWLSEMFTDLNLRKSWKAVSKLHPDTTMFIGDMMDNGRAEMSDEEYEAYYARYHDIFEMDDDEAVYYVPGNHDIGIGSDLFSTHAEERYVKHFGALDQVFEVGNHTFVLLDAPGLVEEDHQRVQSGLTFEHWAALHPGGPIHFVEHMDTNWFHNPLVLITHIPLARPEHSSCGSLRERGTIRQGQGLGYQNTLTPEASQFLLERLRPSAIFSGDDHDYCEYVHELPPSHDDPWAGHRTVKEVTVKAFSMAMGIRRPGVQLVSLLPPSYVTDHASTSISIHTIHDSPCFLPDQLRIYLSVYFPFILLSLLTLIVSNVYRVTTSPPSDNHSPPPPPPGSANLEANFDFEDWRTTTPITMDDQVPLRTVKVDKEHDVEEGFAPTTPGSAATPGTAIFGKPRSGPRPWSKSWSFVFFGRRRRMTIDSAVLGSVLSPFFSDRHQLEANIRGHRVGLIGGFVQDVGRVAWPPLLLFAVITWWAFK